MTNNKPHNPPKQNTQEQNTQNAPKTAEKRPVRKIEIVAAILITLATIVVLNLCSTKVQPPKTPEAEVLIQ